jgi:hypothetical protein
LEGIKQQGGWIDAKLTPINISTSTCPNEEDLSQIWWILKHIGPEEGANARNRLKI